MRKLRVSRQWAVVRHLSSSFSVTRLALELRNWADRRGWVWGVGFAGRHIDPRDPITYAAGYFIGDSPNPGCNVFCR